MTGLLGVVSTQGPEEATRRFGIARDRMTRHGCMVSEMVGAADGSILAGRVHRASCEKIQSATPRAASIPGIDAPAAVFHGVLYNEDALRGDARDTGPSDSLPALLATLYAEHGPAFVSRLSGEFCVALLDAKRKRLFVATDTVGNYPIYWRADRDGMIFCSDLSALIKATPGAARLDLPAVADYLTVGAVLGNKTLVEGVWSLDPGTVLTYDAQHARVELVPYMKLETFFQNKVADKRAYLEAVRVAFTQAVARATSTTRPLGLSLSGGLDSRAILSMVRRDAARLNTYTLGVEGCADQVIARQMAEIAGTNHVFFGIDATYLRDFLPNMAQMVSLTDGFYLSHGLTEMLAIHFLDRTGIAVLLRGHGGELAKAHLAWPFHTDATVYGMKSVDELVPYLSARANYVTPNLHLADVLTPKAAAAAGNGAGDTYRSVLKDTGLSPAESCSYLYLRELHRRFTVPSLELFRTRLDVRLPFLDRQFLEVLLAAPSTWRDTTEIHRTITAAGNPRLLNVRNSNTGARVNAGRLEEFACDKVNAVLKRLNARGYRHYHNFDGWMQTMLLRTVETELLAPAARVQAFVSKTTLGRLIRESREGVADRSHLLQVLLILELWQRENSVEAAA